MTEPHAVEQPALEANSPYELRVDLGKNVPETDVRTALATGEMGFLHSFTTGSTVDGPGVRVGRLDGGVYVEMRLLPQPRHLDDDQRHPSHGPQGDRGTSQVPARAQSHERRLHAERR